MFNKIFKVLFFSTFIYGQWSGGGGKIPSIGVVRGLVADSVTGEFIEYASVSLINQRSKKLVTGGLTDKSGRFSIQKIPLGRYSAVVEFIGYSKKRSGP